MGKRLQCLYEYIERIFITYSNEISNTVKSITKASIHSYKFL